MAGSRNIRPALWVIFGAVGVLTGAGVLVGAFSAATHLREVRDAPACRTDFAAGCVTERAAVLELRGYATAGWLTQEQRWYVSVPEGAPNLVPGDRLRLQIPRQHGQQELDRGLDVTLLYLGRAPAWVRLPSGVVLETEDNPRRAAPMWGWLGLFGFAGGVFGIRTGIRTARSGGAWWRRSPSQVVLGVSSALATAGMVAAPVQIAAGGTAWPGLAAGLLGLAFGIVGALRAKRRATVGAMGPRPRWRGPAGDNHAGTP